MIIVLKFRYTIHQHDAKKAGSHIDLRLEKGSDTHSFALPKDKLPDDNHVYLAVKTHVDYNDKSALDFYGNISPGNYGAGNIKILDQGWYDLLDWPSDSSKIIFNVPYQNGGQKLLGTYYLVKTKGDQYIFGKKKDK